MDITPVLPRATLFSSAYPVYNATTAGTGNKSRRFRPAVAGH